MKHTEDNEILHILAEAKKRQDYEVTRAAKKIHQARCRQQQRKQTTRRWQEKVAAWAFSSIAEILRRQIRAAQEIPAVDRDWLCADLMAKGEKRLRALRGISHRPDLNSETRRLANALYKVIGQFEHTQPNMEKK